MTFFAPSFGAAARRADRLLKNLVNLGSLFLVLTQTQCLKMCGWDIRQLCLLLVSGEMIRGNRAGWLRAWALGLVLTNLFKPLFYHL